MSQRLNDVTGDPIRLSARQREAQREATINVVNQLIAAMNNAGHIVQQHEKRLEAHDAAIALLMDQYADWRRRSFWQRLKALFVGLPNA